MSAKSVNQKIFRGITAGLITLGLLTPINSSAIDPVQADTLVDYVSPGPAFADLFIGGSSGFTVGDFDKDGDPDALVGTNLGELKVYRNSRSLHGESIFYREPNLELVPDSIRYFNAGNGSDPTNTHPELYDYDHDGDMDLFVAFFNQGGSVTPPPNPYYPGILYYANQNNNYVRSSNSITQVVNQLTDLSTTTNWITISLADLNGDQQPDMVVGYGAGDEAKLKVYLNGVPVILHSEIAPHWKKPAPELVDIDRDGLQELFVGYSDGTVDFFENTGTKTQPAFTLVSGAGNPLAGYDFGRDAIPQFSDLDNDLDFDALIASSDGKVTHLRNDGGFFSPYFTYTNEKVNPLGGLDGGGKPLPSLRGGSAIDFANLDGGTDLEAVASGYAGYLWYFKYDPTKNPPYIISNTSGLPAAIPGNFNAVPRFVDIDNNGTIDIFAGVASGKISYFKNFGTSTAPNFYLLPDGQNPLATVDVGDYAAPAFGDLDGDGDKDLLVGRSAGEMYYFQNNGTKFSPSFVQNDPANPMAGILIEHAVPYLIDTDGDGALDCLVGTKAGTMRYFHNEGTPAAPVFVERTGPDSPLDTLTAYEYSAPVLADLDRDGDRDLISGSGYGTFQYFRNVTSDSNPAYRDYLYNPLARVQPADPDIANAVSVNLADADEDGDQDAFIGTPFTGGVPSKLLYYKNLGTIGEPVYKRQPDANNPFAGVESHSLVNVSFHDIDADNYLEAFVGRVLEDRTPLIDYYRYDPATQVFYQPDPGVYTHPISGLFNPPLEYTMGARLQFVDWQGIYPADGLLDVFVSAGRAIFIGINQGSATTPDYPALEWNDSTYNPFFKQNEGLLFQDNSTAVLLNFDGPLPHETAWIGDSTGQILTMRYGFYDYDLEAYYFDKVSEDQNPFSGILLPGPTILAPYDINNDGRMDVFVASSDGRIRLFRGADEPPESNNHVVNLPLIARGN